MADKQKAKTQKKSSSKKSSVKGFFKSLISFFKDKRVHKTFGLFLSLFSVFLFVSFISYFFTYKDDQSFIESCTLRSFFFDEYPVNNWMGRTGAFFSNLFIKKWFGLASFTFILLFFVTGVKIFLDYTLLPLKKTYKHALFWIIWSSTLLGLIFGNDSFGFGGVFGFHTSSWFVELISIFGLGLLLFFSLTVFLFFSYNLSGLKIFNLKPNPKTDEKGTTQNRNVLKDNEDATEDKSNTYEFEIENTNTNNEVVENEEVVDVPNNDIPVEVTIEENKTEIPEEDNNDENTDEELSDTEPYDPTLELPGFIFPGIELLDEYNDTQANVQKDELNKNIERIVETLKNYAIAIIKINATIGPTVTLYEIIPAPGVRISRIKNLEDDIALSLSALGIRIIAPIPGKGTIGIEVPNQNPKIVSMRSIIESVRFQNNKFDLPIGLGKTISDESYVTDLTKMPHLLMAGATGQGKSVGLNAVLASLLYKKHPAQVKFVLIDPKKVELSLFAKIERHYLAKLPDSEEAIITDTRKVVCTLNSLCIEMDQRYDLLKDAQVRNIKEYNTKFIARKLNPNNGHRFLPYIVLIVDEFADLIMTAGKEIEGPIARLAQLARAIGIHLIIATQRPSVNIITGTIKANFPARIAFRVTSKIDSRTILDMGGADQLIGRGDMLLSTGNEITRLQCAFIDIHEVEKITDFIGSQRSYPDAFHLPEYVDELSEGNTTLDAGEKDPMFEEAARLIVNHQQGSTSLIQRKLKLGYNRAGRIIDQLEAAGIVGPFEGSKAREVKFKDIVALEQYLNELNNKSNL